MTKTPFTRFDIYPAYEHGFEFAWEVSPGFSAPAPWEFVVFEGATPDGPWYPVSPSLTTVRRYRDHIKRVVPKSDTLWFMCQMRAGGKRYDSAAAAPYQTLSKREFLIARDIMRRETLHARTLAGVECCIHIISTGGPKCPKCLDPITGQVRDPKCPVCLGTGRAEAYLGPYKAWMTISPKTRTTRHTEVGGTEEESQFEFRLVGTLPLKKNDVIADPGTGRMYYVDESKNAAEIRRVPIVQTVTALEAPVTDPIHTIEANQPKDGRYAN